VLKSCLKLELKGQAYLAGIDGIANTSEENDQYVVQITAKKQKAIEFPLRGRTPSIANHASVSLGDILAAQDEDASRLLHQLAVRLRLPRSL